MNYDKNSTGFAEDCAVLLAEFASHQSGRFEDFCVAWKRYNFQYIFYGHDLDTSLVQFTEDALLVAKHLFLIDTAAHTTSDAIIGALYLLYAIYFKQPTRQYCKIRCTQPEWQRVRDLYTALLAAQPQYDQARLILWKLISADAFRFVECETECGFEAHLLATGQQARARRFASIDHSIGGELNSLRNAGGVSRGLLPALQVLQFGYNEMKGHLNGGGALLQPTTVVDDIVAGIANIEQIFDIRKRGRSVRSDVRPVENGIGERRQLLKAGAGAAVTTATAGAALASIFEPHELQVREEKAKRVYMRRRERALLMNEANMEDVRRVDEQEEKELLISCMHSKEEEEKVAAETPACPSPTLPVSPVPEQAFAAPTSDTITIRSPSATVETDAAAATPVIVNVLPSLF